MASAKSLAALVLWVGKGKFHKGGAQQWPDPSVKFRDPLSGEQVRSVIGLLANTTIPRTLVKRLHRKKWFGWLSSRLATSSKAALCLARRRPDELLRLSSLV